MATIQDALIDAGLAEESKVETFKEKPLWHQIFNVPLTKFEIPILIKVKCETKFQGLKFIADHRLNSIEAENKEEAQLKLIAALNKWYLEPQTGNGMLIYFKPYE